MYWKAAKRVHLKCHHHRKRLSCDVTEVSASTVVVAVLRYVSVSNQRAVLRKHVQWPLRLSEAGKRKSCLFPPVYLPHFCGVSAIPENMR